MPVVEPESEVFGMTRLHEVHVEVPADEWSVLQRETFVARGRGGNFGTVAVENDFVREDGRMIHIGGGFGGYFPWVHAELRAGDSVLRDVGLRYKGNGSYSPYAGLHRNLKVKTDLFEGRDDWEGIETINFNAGGRDSSRMRETLAFAIFRAAGVAAPRTAYAEMRFSVEGTHESATGGLFTVVENVNRRFLRWALPPGDGLLFKPERMQGGVGYYGENWSSYIPIWRPEREATPEEQRRVIEFARLVNQPSVPLFRERIAEFVDVDQFLRFLAVNVLLVNRDSFLGGRHNYYIYLDPVDNLFRFLPWDLDLSFGSFGALGGSNASEDLMYPFSGENPLGYYLLDDPAVAVRYQAIVRELVETVFSEERLLAMIAELEPVVSEPLARESVAMRSRMEYEGGRGGGSSSPRLFILSRMASVRRQLAGWEAARAAAAEATPAAGGVLP